MINSELSFHQFTAFLPTLLFFSATSPTPTAPLDIPAPTWTVPIYDLD